VENTQDYIAQIKQENALLKSENLHLKQKVSDLEEKLSILLSSTLLKDSHNSSLPPSTDFPASKAKRRRSLRKKSGRKTGGQAGHQGSTLEFSGEPDELVDLKTDYCRVCGEDLTGVSAHFHSRRQVFDVALPTVFCIEYRLYERLCSVCGTTNRADYPVEVKAPVQYGELVHSLIAYFSTGQYLPFFRLKKMFSDVFSLSLSEGTLGNSLVKMGQKASLVCEEIQAELLQSKVVGSDETGCNVNGKNQWIWVWQDTQNTLLKYSENRGSQTIQETWEAGLPQSVLVTDRWSAQLKTASVDKQLCLAHLQRDAQYLIESEKDSFASEFKQWLAEVWQAKRESLEKDNAYAKADKVALDLEEKLNQMLLYHIDKEKCPKSHTFQKSMLKYKNYLLTTLYRLEVPPDNNASERAIRNVKVKQKVSGLFKSAQESFCHIRSVIDTAVKRSANILQTLRNIYKYAS